MNTSLSTANQASCASLALVTIGIWLLSLKGITVPDNVSDAVTVLIAGLVHFLTSKLSKPVTPQPVISSVFTSKPTGA